MTGVFLIFCFCLKNRDLQLKSVTSIPVFQNNNFDGVISHNIKCLLNFKIVVKSYTATFTQSQKEKVETKFFCAAVLHVITEALKISGRSPKLLT